MIECYTGEEVGTMDTMKLVAITSLRFSYVNTSTRFIYKRDLASVFLSLGKNIFHILPLSND